MYNFIWQIGEHFIIIYYENAPQKGFMRFFASLRKTERAQNDNSILFLVLLLGLSWQPFLLG